MDSYSSRVDGRTGEEIVIIDELFAGDESESPARPEPSSSWHGSQSTFDSMRGSKDSDTSMLGSMSVEQLMSSPLGQPRAAPRRQQLEALGKPSARNIVQSDLLFDESVYDYPADPMAMGASFTADLHDSGASGAFGLYTVHDYLEDSGLLSGFEAMLKSLFAEHQRGFAPLNLFTYAASEFEKFGRSWEVMRRERARRALAVDTLPDILQEELRRLYATVRIQAAFRGFSVRIERKRELSAVRIQSVYRGHCVRKQYPRSRPQEGEDLDDEFVALEAAAAAEAKGTGSNSKDNARTGAGKNTPKRTTGAGRGQRGKRTATPQRGGGQTKSSSK